MEARHLFDSHFAADRSSRLGRSPRESGVHSAGFWADDEPTLVDIAPPSMTDDEPRTPRFVLRPAVSFFDARGDEPTMLCEGVNASDEEPVTLPMDEQTSWLTQFSERVLHAVLKVASLVA